MSLPLLRGPRLDLRPATTRDIDFLSELNADPEVMTHVSGRPASREETEDEWSRRRGARSDASRGLGYWIGRVDTQPVGCPPDAVGSTLPGRAHLRDPPARAAVSLTPTGEPVPEDRV